MPLRLPPGGLAVLTALCLSSACAAPLGEPAGQGGVAKGEAPGEAPIALDLVVAPVAPGQSLEEAIRTELNASHRYAAAGAAVENVELVYHVRDLAPPIADPLVASAGPGVAGSRSGVWWLVARALVMGVTRVFGAREAAVVLVPAAAGAAATAANTPALQLKAEDVELEVPPVLLLTLGALAFHHHLLVETSHVADPDHARAVREALLQRYGAARDAALGLAEEPRFFVNGAAEGRREGAQPYSDPWERAEPSCAALGTGYPEAEHLLDVANALIGGERWDAGRYAEDAAKPVQQGASSGSRAGVTAVVYACIAGGELRRSPAIVVNPAAGSPCELNVEVRNLPGSESSLIAADVTQALLRPADETVDVTGPRVPPGGMKRLKLSCTATATHTSTLALVGDSGAAPQERVSIFHIPQVFNLSERFQAFNIGALKLFH